MFYNNYSPEEQGQLQREIQRVEIENQRLKERAQDLNNILVLNQDQIKRLQEFQEQSNELDRELQIESQNQQYQGFTLDEDKIVKTMTEQILQKRQEIQNKHQIIDKLTNQYYDQENQRVQNFQQQQFKQI